MKKIWLIVGAVLVVLVAVGAIGSILSPSEPPEPCTTPAEKAYFTAVLDAAEDMPDIMAGFARQNSLAASNPRLFNDQEWIADTALYVGAMRAYANKVDAISPPESLRQLHELLEDSAGEMHAVVTLYAVGVDNKDFKSIDAAGERLIRHNDKLAVFSKQRAIHCGQ